MATGGRRAAGADRGGLWQDYKALPRCWRARACEGNRQLRLIFLYSTRPAIRSHPGASSAVERALFRSALRITGSLIEGRQSRVVGLQGCLQPRGPEPCDSTLRHSSPALLSKNPCTPAHQSLLSCRRRSYLARIHIKPSLNRRFHPIAPALFLDSQTTASALATPRFAPSSILPTPPASASHSRALPLADPQTTFRPGLLPLPLQG